MAYFGNCSVLEIPLELKKTNMRIFSQVLDSKRTQLGTVSVKINKQDTVELVKETISDYIEEHLPQLASDYFVCDLVIKHTLSLPDRAKLLSMMT